MKYVNNMYPVVITDLGKLYFNTNANGKLNQSTIKSNHTVFQVLKSTHDSLTEHEVDPVFGSNSFGDEFNDIKVSIFFDGSWVGSTVITNLISWEQHTKNVTTELINEL